MSSFRVVFGAAAAVVILGACDGSGLFGPCPRDQICVTGSAEFYSFEGGFWAIRGDDDVTYDPLGGMPNEFREAGLRVRLRARERRDVVSFHMAGPIVEIISIRRVE